MKARHDHIKHQIKHELNWKLPVNILSLMNLMSEALIYKQIESNYDYV